MSRRITNESIRDNWEELGIGHFPDDKTIYIPVADMWTEKENLLIVNYSRCYPFKPPCVTYNGQNILTFYGKLSDSSSTKTRDDILKLLCEECMCCSSLVCRNNWNVTNSIMEVLVEFDNFCKIKMRSVERFWSDRIASRFLVEDIPLHEYL